MGNLSKEQEELKSSITKSALVWGGILGLAAGAIAFWLSADQPPQIRTQITGMAVGGVGFLMFWLISSARFKSAKCSQCGAGFSISKSGREEALVSSEEKSEHEKLENGGSKLTTWLEEKFDVVETYTCSSCGNVTTKNFQTTRKKDEVVREKGARSDAGDDVEVGDVMEAKAMDQSHGTKAKSSAKGTAKNQKNN